MPSQTQKFNRRQSMGRNTFEIFHYRDTKPQSVSIHHHDFYEIYFFLGGNVTYFVEGQRHKLSKGDLLLINPRQLHQPLPHKGRTYERMVLWLDRQYLASISQGDTDLASCFQPNQNHVNILHSNVMMQGRIAELFELLNRETNGDVWGGQAYAESLLIQLLVEVNRMVRQKHLLQEKKEELSLTHRVISYINEPFPNAKNEPHRHLEREHLEQFFAACNFIVRLNNPDRVIKHVDGDYDPPCATLPDNHCYNHWYNGHGLDAGALKSQEDWIEFIWQDLDDLDSANLLPAAFRRLSAWPDVRFEC